MNKEEYQQYLQSDHWRQLRAEKRRKVSKSKDGRIRCSICASTERVETHHLFYRGIYDVDTSDLRLLCRRCHQTAHEIIAEGALANCCHKSHHSVFAVTKHLVKKRLGLTGRNLFREASQKGAKLNPS